MKKGCKFCDKEGLPIIPVRYGIAPDKVFSEQGKRQVHGHAPDAVEQFAPPDENIQLGDHERYTLRTLRSGYLFIYDEVSRQWTAYAVTDDAYFFKVPLNDAHPPQAAGFSCSRKAADIAMASVITIDDPETAGNIWFGFSDVWWPQSVRRANQTVDIRKRHMRCIDVGAWYNGGQPGGSLSAHARPVTDIDQIVADYSMRSVPGVLSFVWSPFKFHYKQPEAESIKQACQTLEKDKGVILAIPDPAGIAQELAACAAARWDAFLQQTDADSAHPDVPWSRKAQLDTDLTALEHGLKKYAEHELYSRTAQQAAYTRSRGPVTLKHLQLTPDPLDPARALAKNEVIEALQQRLGEATDGEITLTRQQLSAARNTAWEEYQSLINPTERDCFHKHFQQASQVFDAEYIKPIAQAHARWLNSAAFKAVLEHHFDSGDINAGLALAGLVYVCISGTSALLPCQRQYEQWLMEAPTSDNPIWRALRLNNDTLGQALQQAAGSSVIEWSVLWEVYANALEDLKMVGDITVWRDTTAQVLNPLLVELSTPTAKILAQYRSEGSGKALRAMLGMHTGMPVRVVQVVGTRRELYSAMLDQLLRMPKGKAMNLGSLKAAVEERMTIWAAQGVPLDDEIRHWALLFDEQAAEETAVANLSAEQRTLQAVNAVAAPAELSPQAGRMTTIDPDTFLGKLITCARMPTLAASGSLILEIVNFQAITANEKTALKGTTERARLMVTSARAGVIGGTFDLVGVAISSNITRQLPFVGGIAEQLSGRFLLVAKGVGLAAGAVAMGIAAGVDGWNAYEAFAKEERGMSALYAMNFFTEGIAAGMFLWPIFMVPVTSTIVAVSEAVVPLIAIAFGLSLLIGWLNDPATIDWAGDCLWGRQNSDTYTSGDEEHADFLKATGLA